MNLLPDWAPNIHPLVIHFPIALLFGAVLVDAVAMFAKKSSSLRHAATWLFVLGGVAATAAWFTGTQAADSVFLPTGANAPLTEHADLGQWTFWFFGGYAILRLLLGFGSFATRGLIRVPLFLLGLGGLGLLVYTADHGAELVFRYGVGVQAVEDAPPQQILPKTSADDDLGGLTILKDSVWTLLPSRPAAWMRGVTFLSGSGQDIQPSLVDGGERGDVLAIRATDADPLFVVPDTLSSIQVDFVANLDALEGTMMIAHHVGDSDNFGFLSLDRAELRLGSREQGDFVVANQTDLAADGWHEYRLVVDGAHSRVYRDTELVAHIHGDELEPGPVGIRLNGSGRLFLSSIQVTALR